MHHFLSKLSIYSLCLTLCAVSMARNKSSACDICGCGSGASFMGMIPQYGRSQIALRTHYGSYLHPNTDLNYNGASRVLRDDLSSAEITYRHFHQRWVLSATLPVKNNVRHESLRTSVNQGLGDAQLGALFTLVNNADSMELQWKHLLAFGGQLRLPTGKYMQRDETKTMLPVLMQTGTGAYAWTSQVYYTVRYKRWGALTNMQYTIAAANELNYQWGNQTMASSALFYKRDVRFKKKNQNAAPYASAEERVVSILPSIGYTLEHSAFDKEHKTKVEHTGGTAHLLSASLDVYAGRMAFSIYYQHALQQVLTDAQPINRHRAGVALVWLLNERK